MANTLVLVNSADRVTGTATNFRVLLKDPIKSAKSVELLQALIPNTAYNITTDNNVINFNDGAAKSATIPVGGYSAASLATQIASSLTTASGVITFSCSFSTTTFKFTISGTAAFTLSFSLNPIATTLGFARTNLSAASTYTAPNTPALITDYYHIEIAEINSVITTTAGESSTFIVPANTNAGDVINFQTNNSYPQKIVFSFSQSFQMFTLRLLRKFNSSYSPVDLNGSNWSFLLRMEY